MLSRRMVNAAYAAIVCVGIVGVCTALPLPTPQQLAWQNLEIGVLIHYNMATAAGTQGCDPSQPPPFPETFDPTATAYTDQWMEAATALGAKYAVYVAKHNCGFTTWPTKVSFPKFSFVYNYSVSYSKGQPDVVQMFIDSCTKYNILPGFYYSTVINAFLDVANGQVQNNTLSPPQVGVTQQEYDQILLAQITELWSRYPNLTEIWFDGGVQDNVVTNVTQIVNSLQSNAVTFNGFGVGVNPVRWIGTEAGYAPDDNWSTGNGSYGGGDPNGEYWLPAECDTTMQEQDQWFYNPNVTSRTLAELIEVYHRTVGRNCNLLMDIGPMPSGLLPVNTLNSYKMLGTYINLCYGTPPLANVSTTASVTELTVPHLAFVDRVLLMEDQSKGQRVREFLLEGMMINSTEFITMGQGQSIGHKRIQLFTDGPVQLSTLRLSITSTVDTPQITTFAAYECSELGPLVESTVAAQTANPNREDVA